MASIPRLGKPKEITGDIADPSQAALLEQTINREVVPSQYGVILPPSFLRRERTRGDIQYAAMCSFYQRLGIVCEVADDPNRKDTDRLKAIAMLGQFGVGERVSVTLSDSELIRTVCRILAHKFNDEELAMFMDTLKVELDKAGT